MSVTTLLVVANVAAFGLELVLGDAFAQPLVLWPLGAQFAPWQLVTYAFMHASVVHVAFNMIGLRSFGLDLERLWGARRYLVYYFTCAVAAGLAQLAVSAFSGTHYPTAGASGAVFGLLLAYAVFFPQRRVMLLFPPIVLPAPVFAVVYGILELVLGVTGTEEGVAHFAHLGGMAGGLLLLWLWRARA
ncbi:MAG: rhomboid family intramembrane serine protease [Usitatibacter sp.]